MTASSYFDIISAFIQHFLGYYEMELRYPLLSYASVTLERNELRNIDWTDREISMLVVVILFLTISQNVPPNIVSSSFFIPSGLCFFLSAMFLFTLHSLVPYLMRKAGATIFNLSILSADFYALVVGLTLFRYEVSS